MASSATPPSGGPSSVAVHAGFAFVGLACTLLGPLLPSLAARWSLGDAQAGALFTAQFVGSICGVLISSVLMARWGFRPTLVAGFVCVAAGVAAMAVVPVAGAFAAIFGNGVGLGLTIPTSNMYVAATARSQERVAASLNVLNLWWGVGAMVCPWIVAAVGLNSTREFLLAVAAVAGAFAVCLVLVRFPTASSAAAAAEAESATHSSNGQPAGLGQVAGVAGLFFLYVGIEVAVVGWIAAYAQRAGQPGSDFWIMMPSFFWAPFLAGRALAPLVLRRVSESMVVRGGLLLGLAGITLLLAAPTSAGIGVGIAAAGLGFAAIFPLLVALLTQCFGRGTRLAGPMFAAGNIGGATLPWVVGLISARVGTLQAGLLVPLAAGLAMFALYSVVDVSQPNRN